MPKLGLLKKVVQAETYSAPTGPKTETAETHEALWGQKKGDAAQERIPKPMVEHIVDVSVRRGFW